MTSTSGLYSAQNNTQKPINTDNGLKLYDDTGYESIMYNFPLSVNIKSYTMKFADDSFPVRWYFHIKTPQNTWKLVDSASFIANDGLTVSPSFDTSGYTKTFDNSYITDSVMLLINLSTGKSVKIKEFLVYDEIGINKQIIVPFCLSTNSLYHSGSLNFSMIDGFSIDTPVKNTNFFAVNHNFLVLENGMGDVMYT